MRSVNVNDAIACGACGACVAVAAARAVPAARAAAASRRSRDWCAATSAENPGTIAAPLARIGYVRKVQMAARAAP